MAAGVLHSSDEDNLWARCLKPLPLHYWVIPHRRLPHAALATADWPRHSPPVMVLRQSVAYVLFAPPMLSQAMAGFPVVRLATPTSTWPSRCRNTGSGIHARQVCASVTPGSTRSSPAKNDSTSAREWLCQVAAMYSADSRLPSASSS